MSTFDELFESFFGGDKPNKENKKNINKIDKIDKIDNEFQSKSKDFIDMLSNMKDNNEIEDISEMNREIEKLGKPDIIELYMEDEIYFKKSVWYTDMGYIIKTEISEKPFDMEGILDDDDLLTQLDNAVSDENYEKAAELRDKIRDEKKIQKQ